MHDTVNHVPESEPGASASDKAGATPAVEEELLASGGGSGPAAGVPFEAEVGAYFAAIGMASDVMPERLELGGEHPASFRFETEVPVDDLLILTSAEGRIFFQIKTNLGFLSTPGSEMFKTVDQIVRLWKLCTTGNGSKKWNRPLNKDTDRIVIAVGKETPATVAQDLAEALKRRREGAVLDATPDDLANALTKFRTLLRNAWKEVYGAEPADAGIEAILDHVVVIPFTPADFEVGALTLAKNLADEQSAKSSFAALARICEARMQSRTGFDMQQIRRALEAKGVVMLAPADYRRDQKILLEYSTRIGKRLAVKSQLRIDDAHIVPIPRAVTDVVAAAALTDSVLVVGEPGVGKSGVLHNVTIQLEASQAPVLTLKVEGSAAGDLQSQIGIRYLVRTLLEHWPGVGPAYLLIDGLDEARGGPAETAYRTLITETLELPDKRWRVVASARTFDLRVGVQFRPLFQGTPPSTADREPGEAFDRVRHVLVRRWTESEFEQILQALPKLRGAIEVGGEKLRELAGVPFNTQLLADVAASGIEPEKLGSIQSQVQLLRTYWDHRVRSGGMAAEACLELVVKTMVEKPFKNVAVGPIRQQHAPALEVLLRQGVLVDPSDGRFLAFQHNILFDYAASRLYLDPFDEDQLKHTFARAQSLGLLLGPALSFALKQLWEENGDRALFWKQLILLTADRNVDAIARCQASRTAAELVASNQEIEELIRQLRAHAGAKPVVEGLAGALSVLLEDAPKVVTLAPWGFAIAEFSNDERLDGNVGALVDMFLKRDPDAATYNLLGLAARRLLTRGFADVSIERHGLVSFCVGLVGRTYSSDPAESKALLIKIFEKERLEKYAYVEVPALAREIRHIGEADPGFASEIYRLVFGHHVSSEQETNMSGNILPMKSNVAQDYDMARYALAQYFPAFLDEDVAASTEAVIGVMEGYE